MEYASDGNDRVARNLFELGLENFISVPGYVLQYVNFLEGLADIHNVRALFERALGETAPVEAGPLWERYIQVYFWPQSKLQWVAAVQIILFPFHWLILRRRMPTCLSLLNEKKTEIQNRICWLSLEGRPWRCCSFSLILCCPSSLLWLSAKTWSSV